MASSSTVRAESVPVIDLRLLSQSELLSLSQCATDWSSNDDGVLIPKIDRSVFNESAGSRKQTYSRLRLAPSAAVAARRSQKAQSQTPEPLIGPDSFQLIGLLKRLFASDSDSDHLTEDLVPVVAPPSLPVGTVADGSGDAAREVVLGLAQGGEAVAKPKRGRPRKNLGDSFSVSCPDDSVSKKRGRPRKKANSVAENRDGGFGTVNLGDYSAGESVAAVGTLLSVKRKVGRPRKLPKAEEAGERTCGPLGFANAAFDSSALGVLPVPVSSANAVLESPAMDAGSVTGIAGGDGTVKRRPGRPRKVEIRGHSSAEVEAKNAGVVGDGVGGIKNEDLVKVNGIGEVVDLAALGSLEDPVAEELRRRTEGLATEAELMGFLGGLAGDWEGKRWKKKIVQATEFGNAFPSGWKIQLFVKRRDQRAWLICGRYISPDGQQFDSYKEVCSHLLAYFRPQDNQSESGLADGNTLVPNKSMQEDLSNVIEDHKNGGELVSCSRAPTTSVVCDLGEQGSHLERMNPGEIGFENASKYHHSMLRCGEKNDQDHQACENLTRTNPYHDGLLLEDGKYKCKFCLNMFDDESHYGDHVLVYGKICAEHSKILQRPNMPKNSSPLSNSASPRPLKTQESIGIEEEKPSNLEPTDKLDHGLLDANLKLDSPYQTCSDKEKEETVSGTCIFGKDQGFYEKQTKTSYLTTEELGKLDESWLVMGFQSNVFTPFNVDDLDNSSNNVVDVIQADDSRNCKGSEYSVSFDGEYTRIGEDTISRVQQEEIFKGSSVLTSDYDCDYASKDILMPMKKNEEVKQDRSVEIDLPRQSDHAVCLNYLSGKKISPSSPTENSKNNKVKTFWSNEALGNSDITRTVIDMNAGKSIVSGMSSERLSQVNPGTDRFFPIPDKVPGNSSNVKEELKLTRNPEFGFIYPSGDERIHAADTNQNIFSTSTLQEQPKFEAANQAMTGSIQDSRSCGDYMFEINWRTDDENFRSSRLTDTDQMSSCFPDISLPEKDVFGRPGDSLRFDDLSEFEGLEPGSTQQQYNFLSAQGTSNLNDPRDSLHKQDADSIFWFSKEDTSLFSKTAGRHPTLTICIWCRKEFYNQDVSSQMKSGSLAVICPTCQSKFLG